MKKKKKKLNLKRKLKGFTLVELLAVIVILAIIMIIAIPNVLNTMSTAKKKSFVSFAQKCLNEADKVYVAKTTYDSLIKPSRSTTYVYNIRDDIGINNPGNYYGIVAIELLKHEDGNEYLRHTLFIFDEEYALSYDDYDGSPQLSVDLIKAREDKIPTLNNGKKIEDYDLKMFSVITKINDLCNWWDDSVVDGVTNTQYLCTNKNHRQNFEDENGKMKCKTEVEQETANKVQNAQEEFLKGNLVYSCE